MRRYFLRLLILPGGGAAAFVAVALADRLRGGRLSKTSRDIGMPPPEVVAAAGGAAYGLGFAVIRPALPRRTEAAGAVYAVSLQLVFWGVVRAVYRIVERPLPSFTPRQITRSIARSAVEGALVAEAERLVR